MILSSRALTETCNTELQLDGDNQGERNIFHLLSAITDSQEGLAYVLLPSTDTDSANAKDNINLLSQNQEREKTYITISIDIAHPHHDCYNRSQQEDEMSQQSRLDFSRNAGQQQLRRGVHGPR